jgi:CheY-like chemotaxis protein
VIETEMEAGGAFCLVDARKIDQVLNNLLGNAIKFSPINSTIRVSVSADAAAVTIAVRDEGPGIAAEEIERLFRPFQTGKARGTAGERSTGLGLAIANSIVGGHGGTVQVTSSPGEGSTFSFTLPRIAPPETAEPPPLPRRDAARASPVRVLLAEDNVVNQTIGKMMLVKVGATVSIAGDGREALELLDRGGIDLVLMDCQMPGMDGYEAAAAIRASERSAGNRRRIPIIAMTASAEDDDRRRCLAAGMDDFLQKPALPQKLAEIIERWVGARAR